MSSNKVVWASTIYSGDFNRPIYYGSIPLVLPLGAVLEITTRSNKRQGTITEVVTVRMPKKREGAE